MKNLSFLSVAFLIFSILFFSGCKKEEELSTKDKLIGKWKYETLKFEQYINGELTNSGTDTVRGTTIEFRANDTYASTYEIAPNQPSVTTTGNWTIDQSNKIVLGDIGNRQVLQLQEITETTMILIEEAEEIADDGNAYGYRNEASLIKQQ